MINLRAISLRELIRRFPNFFFCVLGLFFGRLPEDECRIPGKRKTRVCKTLTKFPQKRISCSVRMSFLPGRLPVLGGTGPRVWPSRVTDSPGDPKSMPELEPGINLGGSIITQPADFSGRAFRKTRCYAGPTPDRGIGKSGNQLRRLAPHQPPGDGLPPPPELI